MADEQDQLLTGSRVAAALGLFGPSGGGIALMSLSFPGLTLLFWTGFVVALMGAAGAVWVAIYEFRRSLPARYVVAIVALAEIVLPVAVLCAAIVHIEPSENKSLDGQIKYKCDFGSLPDVWPDDDRLFYLQVIGPPESGISPLPYAMYTFYNSGAKPSEFAKTFENSIFECVITNYSPRAIMSFKAGFTITWNKIVKNGASLANGDVINSEYVETPDFQLGIATNTKAKFFIINQSHTLIMFSMPETALVKVAGAEKAQAVKLLLEEPHFSALGIWPIERYIKDLRSPPPPAPAPQLLPEKK